MSQITKMALAASLKKMLATKPLDKITVIDIVEDCGVNRQTFYYHFKDIYDLVEWIYTIEAAKAIGNKRTYDTWQEGFLHIFQYVFENKTFVSNTYHSLSREHLERYLYDETYDLLISVVEEKAAGIPVNQDDKRFIANFYKYAFTGLMLEWIRTGMKEDPSLIIERLSILIHGDIAKTLEKFRTDR
ncbi:TetR/AcrR family transcriptional regulator [Caproiciproducens sp.]|uniref:TetR/AcrR family transcriptional regulator n=1 Tax=Caproiciproducens sp. TaxID=1954376 RepID=UPI0028A26815|nr:TetR/AcrR family transcriptional regulator [Caproiciproducens sp.]